MKIPIFIVILLLIFIVSCYGFSAQQLISFTNNTVGTPSGLTTYFKPSTNVILYYISGTSGITYSAGSNHNMGSKSYAATSVNPHIYWKDGTDVLSLTPPVTVTDTSVPTGFTTSL